MKHLDASWTSILSSDLTTVCSETYWCEFGEIKINNTLDAITIAIGDIVTFEISEKDVDDIDPMILMCIGNDVIKKISTYRLLQTVIDKLRNRQNFHWKPILESFGYEISGGKMFKDVMDRHHYQPDIPVLKALIAESYFINDDMFIGILKMNSWSTYEKAMLIKYGVSNELIKKGIKRHFKSITVTQETVDLIMMFNEMEEHELQIYLTNLVKDNPREIKDWEL